MAESRVARKIAERIERELVSEESEYGYRIVQTSFTEDVAEIVDEELAAQKAVDVLFGERVRELVIAARDVYIVSERSTAIWFRLRAALKPFMEVK